MAASDLVTATASTVNPTRLVLKQADAARPCHVRFYHPPVAEYNAASGVGTGTGNQGLNLNGLKGREAFYVDFGGDARWEIQVRESGVKNAPWQTLTGWQALVGATTLTGNPSQIRLY